MLEATKNEAVASSHWWWLERNNLIERKRSPWLQLELAELNEKTRTMLELIDVDADSFAQRADMYFEKRPQLINLVEDLYRFHRSLAVQFDHLKSHLFTSSVMSDETDIHHPQIQPLEESTSDHDIQPQVSQEIESDKEATSYYDKDKGTEENDANSDQEIRPQESEEIESEKEARSYYDKDKGTEENDADSSQEIRPQESEEIESEKEARSDDDKEKEVKENDELLKLKGEMERAKAENWSQKEQLMRKDEEKREVIRQLSLAIDLLREENVNLRQEMSAIRVSSRSRSVYNQREERFCSRLFRAFD